MGVTVSPPKDGLSSCKISGGALLASHVPGNSSGFEGLVLGRDVFCTKYSNQLSTVEPHFDNITRVPVCNPGARRL